MGHTPFSYRIENGKAVIDEADFLNKTRVKNNGIVPQYYVEGNHEAIIPKDIFLRVQEELVRILKALSLKEVTQNALIDAVKANL